MALRMILATLSYSARESRSANLSVLVRPGKCAGVTQVGRESHELLPRDAQRTPRVGEDRVRGSARAYRRDEKAQRGASVRTVVARSAVGAHTPVQFAKAKEALLMQIVVQIDELIGTASMEVLSRVLDCDDDESLE
jgi:hypothetical protein